MISSKPSFCLLDGATTNPGDLDWGPLEECVDLTVYERTPADHVVERAAGCSGIITNKVLLTKSVLGQLPDCKAIFLLSTGTNAVDLSECANRQIPVCNIPEYSTTSVAELVIAYLLDWAKGVPVHAAAVRKGHWASCEDFTFSLTPQRELSGCTLGLVGFGAIAQAVARIAGSLGMKVLASTPHPEGKPDLGQTFLPLEEVLASSDIVSLHCPLTDSTEKMINADTLAQMKEGSVLINTGRGSLVDENALSEALSAGRLDSAYLDVLSQEPPEKDHPLTRQQRAIITPHIAWATRAARQRLINQLTDNIRAWLSGQPRNVVNGI